MRPKLSPGAGRAKIEQRPIRVLLSGQQTLVRAGIRALLEQIKEVEVAEAADREQLLAAVKNYDPHVILLDLSHEGYMELIKEVVEKFPANRVIALLQHDSEQSAIQALRSGAAGFIAESAAAAELESAIKAVAAGDNYVGAEIARGAALKFLATSRSLLRELTARQCEVLKMIAEGHATKEIARRLQISVKTVETHRTQIMERLNIHSTVGLVHYALRIGLIKLSER